MPKQNPKPRSLRAQAFEESNYPAAVGLRCVEVQIPDDDAYAVQLAGLIALATKQFNYQNKDEAQAAIVAGLWRDAYVATDWEGCMTCEDVRDCIETNQDVRDAIIGAANGSQYPPNQPLPESELTRNLAAGTNPTCDLDIVWAQALAIVQETNRLIVDMLERMEIQSNAVELAGVAASAPGLENLGISSITDFINITQEAIAENYNAAYDTDYENELACEIFCACRVDCEVTVDRIYEIILARAQASISGVTGDWLTIVGFLLDLADYEITTVNVADFVFLLCWGGLKLANWLTPFDIGTKILELVLSLSVNDANDDWELLCTDCPEIPNISLRDTYPGVIVGDPVFLANTMTGGSIWEATYSDQGGGSFAVAVTPQIGGVDVCCILVSAAPVNNYQHFPCAGGVVSGAGSGAGSTEYSDLGFYYSSAATITIEIEPVP